MELTILGCLGAYPYEGKGTSAYLLASEGFHLLIDAGSTTLVVLEKHLDPLALDAVILSHYHHDHIADLGVLQYYRQLYPTSEVPPVLPIYGHTEDVFHFEALHMEGISQAVPYFEGEAVRIGPFWVQFMKTIHPVPCFAMRFVEEKTGKTLVYTGDSGYLETFVSFAKDADVFLADTYLFAGQERHHAHLTSKEAGELAKAAQVKQLILTHLPVQGSLDLLKQQALQACAPQVAVSLAEQGRVIVI